MSINENVRAPEFNKQNLLQNYYRRFPTLNQVLKYLNDLTTNTEELSNYCESEKKTERNEWLMPNAG